MTAFELTTAKKIYVENYGLTCELSAFNVGRVYTFLRANGYTCVRHIGQADVVLLNSCCVISGKRDQVRKFLTATLKRPHIEKVVLFGCFAGLEELDSPQIVKIPGKNIEQVDEHFAHEVSIRQITIDSLHPDIFLPYQTSFDAFAKYVLICQGCVNRCSYCNIKHAKGVVQSRPVDEIIEQIGKSVHSDGDATTPMAGDEIILLADDCGSYGRDIGTSLIQLIRGIFTAVPSIRLRIHYLFPSELVAHRCDYEELFATGRITYVNFPIQSGSQRILDLMSRRYDIAMVLEIVKQIRVLSPGTWLYTHIIVNFPTETPADLAASLSAAEMFDELLFMNYSKNPLTPAYQYPDVEPQQKRRSLDSVSAFLHSHQGLLIDAESGAVRR